MALSNEHVAKLNGMCPAAAATGIGSAVAAVEVVAAAAAATAQSAFTTAGAAVAAADLAATTHGHGASLVGVENAGTLFVAADVESALAEIAGSRPALLQASSISYDGDPNDGAAPAVVSGASVGTLYMQVQGTLWRKTESSVWTALADAPIAVLVGYGQALPVDPDWLCNGTAGNSPNQSIYVDNNTPVTPRNLTVTFDGGWDGGDITISGLDQFGEHIVETFVGAGGVTRTGFFIFRVIGEVTKSAVGAKPAEVTVGTGAIFGATKKLANGTVIVFVDGIPEVPALVDTSNSTITTTTGPDGNKVFAFLLNT